MKSFLVNLILTLWIVFTTQYLYSQNFPTPLKKIAAPEKKQIHATGFRGGFGVLIPHRESMIHLVTGHVASAELYFERCGYKRNWNKYYRYPTTGISFYYAYLANREILGNAFSLDFYGNLHLIKHKKFLFDLRLATGIGYLTKLFDASENNHNVAIGTHFNISVGVSFDFKYRITNNWLAEMGLSLKHFSNGSFSTPNLGINIPVIMIGLKKHFVSSREYSKFDTSFKTLLKNQYIPAIKINILTSLGAKEIYPAGGNRYGAYSLLTNFIYAGNYKSAFSAGADLIHNVALYKHAYFNDTLTNLKQIQFTQIGLHAGYIQMFDKFEIIIQCAYYVMNKYNKDGNFYQRLGGRYYFNKNLTGQLALKTHFAKADYIEFGIGWFFKKELKKEKDIK